ncbi:MAG: exonuclease SbcCD subunit D [Actinobacteria bacterium]|nr:exonuclease SbcCD subunit D [Actinomycetota bacterium]
MKILHTSDWHVGRTIRGRSRADEHRAVLGEIAGIAHDEDVDLILVTGDQFDTAAPSPESEQIVYQALLDLAATGAHVVVLSGNHDNPRRWGAIRPLLELTNVHAAATVARPDRGGVIDLPTRSGETARIALLPFLSQRSIVQSEQLMQLDADQHSGQYAGRMRSIISALTDEFGGDTVNIVAGHLTVASDQPVMGGGERMAHTIFDYFVPPAVFPSTAHYVALGHLHQAHRIPGPCPIWYCGSPMQLDFGEREREHKQVLIAEASPGVPAEVRAVDLTTGKRLRTVRGTVAELADRRDDLGDAYVRVVVEEKHRAGLADEVRDLLPSAVDVSVADPEEREREAEVWDLAAFQRSPIELFAEYLAEHDIEDDALTVLFRDLLEDAHAADAT